MDTIKLCRTITDIYKVKLPNITEITLIEVPFQTGRSKHGTLLIEPDNKPASDKDPLDLPPNELKNIVRGLIWRDEHFAGMTLRQIAAREQMTPRYISRLIERTFSLA